MSQLGPVGVGLSVAFAVFMAVLAVELYYVLRSRQRTRPAEATGARSSDAIATSAAVPAAVQKWYYWIGCLELARHGGSWTALRAKEAMHWVKLRLHCVLLRRPRVKAVGNGWVEAPLEAREVPEAGDEADEEDIFKLGGLWGPPRLLFTITEETKEEMDLEDVRSRAGGKGSRRASRASSELVFVPSSSTSPYVTPPSSPPFATPFGSPGPLPPTKPFLDMDSTSSSSTTSSSPRLNRRPLSALFEETSSFSSSSAASSSATPATLSPPPPLPSSSSPKRQRRPLGLLFEPPPSPSSALYHYHNRVLSHSSPSRRVNIDGNPVLACSLPKSEHPAISPPTPPSSSPPRFCLPAPSQPTIPSPFRFSSHIYQTKPNGFLVSQKVKPAYFAEV